MKKFQINFVVHMLKNFNSTSKTKNKVFNHIASNLRWNEVTSPIILNVMVRKLNLQDQSGDGSNLASLVNVVFLIKCNFVLILQVICYILDHNVFYFILF